MNTIHISEDSEGEQESKSVETQARWLLLTFSFSSHTVHELYGLFPFREPKLSFAQHGPKRYTVGRIREKAATKDFKHSVYRAEDILESTQGMAHSRA